MCISPNNNEQETHPSITNDLKGIKTYNAANIPGFYTLAMAIVGYKGHRVVAQSIIIGFFFSMVLLTTKINMLEHVDMHLSTSYYITKSYFDFISSFMALCVLVMVDETIGIVLNPLFCFCYLYIRDYRSIGPLISKNTSTYIM